jgi:uncharacterized damage-inducible protein DinB
MELTQHLLDTFRYNDYANKRLLTKIAELNDPDECIRLFSHLINSMNKWLGRIEKWPGYAEMDWWLPAFEFRDLERKWSECFERWIAFIERKTEEDLCQEVEFVGFDGYDFAATPKDIALQLNYHSIHHRAQIQYLIRLQGKEPDFLDYIGTKYRKLS